MIPDSPKRLIEVDLPIKQISSHSRKEKMARQAKLSAIHTWWARRPLAACRAVICAALWPDPADPLCPKKFREEAQQFMTTWVTRHLELVSPENYDLFVDFQKHLEKLGDGNELRAALLAFISDFANSENSSNKAYLETSRGLTRVAHQSLGGAPDSKPLLVDTFCGGGAIPFEALRVGCDVFASDLNPIPVLMNKIQLEYVPRFGRVLADEVRKLGGVVGKAAESALAELYPKSADGSVPIAYFWARTVLCEGPNCGAKVPVMRSLWLAKKPKRKIALELVPNKNTKEINFRIRENVQPKDVGSGTARRSAVTCPICGYTTPRTQVERQANALRPHERLIAVVESSPKDGRKRYRLPSDADLKAIESSKQWLQTLGAKTETGLTTIPTEPLPYLRSIFNVHVYGYKDWGSLFNPRQLSAICTMLKLSKELLRKATTQHEKQFDDALALSMAFCADRVIANCNTLCWWVTSWEVASSAFARQALGMVWDFTEINPFASDEGWNKVVDWYADAIEALAAIEFDSTGSSHQLGAASVSLPNDSVQIAFTDPPYYDAVPYADLSDFFYVWLRRSVGQRYPDLFGTELSPKTDEIVELAGRNASYAHKTKQFFESQMCKALAHLKEPIGRNGIAVIVFAHTSTESWEALLQAVISAGLKITASWPIDTEKSNRPRAQSSATLSSSVHIVCRSRGNEDGVGDWRDVLHELPERLHEWMPRLALEGVVGADAIFSCLGPALEVFSRYGTVEKASGEVVTLREYLEHVWAAVAKEALNVIFEGADVTGFEEDARLTAMWLWTLSAGPSVQDELDSEKEDEEEAESSGAVPKGFVLEYDAARKIAQGLGAHIEDMSSLVEIKGEVARLLPVAERTRKLFLKEDGESKSVVRKRKAQLQLGFLAELEQAEESSTWGNKGAPTPQTTVLNRVHQSMLLFAANRGEALRRFLVDEGVGVDQRFWRLAQVLSYLYPKTSEEKRWIDGVLARKKGLGF
jgi:adenine-specific DNA methylase